MSQEQSTHRGAGRLGRWARVGTAVSAVGAATLAGAGVAAASPHATGHRAGSRVSASTLAKLRKEVAAAEAVPRFTAPGPAVSAKVLKGKSALVMPINSEIGTCNHQAASFTKLGDSLGMHVTSFSDSGQPSQWISGIGQATSAHDSALVMLCGIIPGAVGPQLTAAARGGVKIVDGNYNEVPASQFKGLNAENGVEVAPGLQTDVADALVNLHGAPLHALLVTSSSVVQGPASITAVRGAIKRDCGSACSLDQVMNVQVQDWATQVQGDVASALQAHKDVNAVFIAFDGMTPFVVPAIESAHRPSVKVYTWGGSASVEKLMLQKSPIVVADPAPDETWDAWEAMDQVIRLLSHKAPAPVGKEVVPNRFWVPSNVKAFFAHGTSGYGNGGFGGNAFKNGFRKLWGL